MKNWRWLGTILLVVAAVTLLGGCAGSNASGTTPSSSQTAVAHVVKVYSAPG